MTHKQPIYETLHYLAIGMLVCICGYLAYDATHAISSFESGALTGLSAKDVSELSAQTFERVNDVNFFGFLLLCVSAIWLYIKHHALTPFFANLIGYFVILCVAYFWVGDMLFVFERKHELWEGGFSASLIIVPIKLAMAGGMGYVSYLLAKHIKQSAKDKPTQDQENSAL